MGWNILEFDEYEYSFNGQWSVSHRVCTGYRMGTGVNTECLLSVHKVHEV